MSFLEFLKNYAHYLQVLIIAGFFYLLIWLILNYISPTSMAHWLWPDSYLLFQALLWTANFFFFTFLAQSKRVGIWASSSIASWLFFKLSHFQIDLPLIIAISVSNILLFCWLVLWPQLNDKKKQESGIIKRQRLDGP